MPENTRYPVLPIRKDHMMLWKDYIPQALRTKSDQVHTDKISLKDAAIVLGMCECMAATADFTKKGLFYGKTPPSDERIEIESRMKMLTIIESPPPSADNIHALLGMVTEVSELAEATRVGLHASKMDELGDLFWYIAIYCNENGIDPEEAMSRNIIKLRARFPHKFDASLAIGKDTRAERLLFLGDVAG